MIFVFTFTSFFKHIKSIFSSTLFIVCLFVMSSYPIYKSSGISGSLAFLGGHTTPLVGGRGGLLRRRCFSSLAICSSKEVYLSSKALCSASLFCPYVIGEDFACDAEAASFGFFR